MVQKEDFDMPSICHNMDVGTNIQIQLSQRISTANGLEGDVRFFRRNFLIQGNEYCTSRVVGIFKRLYDLTIHLKRFHKKIQMVNE